MAALGPCGNINASTYISVNELTTVAAVYALAPFMNSASSVASGTSDVASLANAFAFAAELANSRSGQVPGDAPTGVMVPVTEINTLADLIGT